MLARLRQVGSHRQELVRLTAAAVPQFRTLCSADESSKKDENKSRVEELIKDRNVVLFMKGTPEKPMCGFSNAVVQILNMHGVENYSSYNVLEDETIRQGVKSFSNWPTIPQVFVNGEFLGGCDILLQMHQNGELVEVLQSVGIRSVLLDSKTKKEDKK